MEETDCSVNLKNKSNSLTKHTAIITKDKWFYSPVGCCESFSCSVVIRTDQYGKLRMIPHKLAEQFILLNLTYSFLPLNKYALCPFERSICSFLRLIHVQRESQESWTMRFKQFPLTTARTNSNSWMENQMRTQLKQTFVHKNYSFTGTCPSRVLKRSQIRTVLLSTR